MTTSTVPAASPAIVSCDSFSLWKRESSARRTGNPEKRSWKVS